MVPACGAADVQHACTALEVFTGPKIHTVFDLKVGPEHMQTREMP